ncbi:MAG: capsular biosynthesis protein [Omnitrophica bacterium]|nr:capsular biosynthesis protein [Candidatus Omnitrophota bacterium]
MNIVALPYKARRIKKFSGDNTKWCYIGKNISLREKIAKVMGRRNKRFYFSKRLHKITENLRQPYIEFVGELGKTEKDPLNWWASRFASKSHMQTDFFLLLCYKTLAMELAKREIESGGRLIIFIEDPWLFADIKDALRHQEVIFSGRTTLFVIGFLYGLRGVLRRALLAAWVVIARLAVGYFHKGVKPRAVEAEGRAVLILNPAEMRAFKDGRYLDNYMPGLADFYKKNKIPYFYLYMLRSSLAAGKCIGLNKEILWPLLLDLRLSDALKRIFEYWSLPSANSTSGKSIAGYGVSILLLRERLLEFSSAGFNLHLMLFDALDAFFKKKWQGACVYVFENQPWEKMLCMAAAKNGVKFSGYQHSSISRFYLSQFIGKEESLFTPLPYKLITSGSHFAELYKEGGIPEERVVVGGAWRYPHMTPRTRHEDFTKKTPRSKPTILIPLGMNMTISKSLLDNIFRFISKHSLDGRMNFWVKFHPGSSKRELDKLKSTASKYQIVDEPFDILLKDADIVIYCTSASGLEAFLCGKKVISYIPENFLIADPLSDIRDERIYRWHEGEDINIDFLENYKTVFDQEHIDLIKNKFFSNINHKIWFETATV